LNFLKTLSSPFYIYNICSRTEHSVQSAH